MSAPVAHPVKTLLLAIACVLLSITPAHAVLRQHHANEGMRYHSHHSLKDPQGSAWQVLVFPEAQSNSERYSLRLVGFPGVAEFVHPHPLEMMTSTKIVLGSDRFAQTAPAPNVGQYDVTDILPRLSPQESLQLIVPLRQKELTLHISPEIIVEWQWLLEEHA